MSILSENLRKMRGSSSQAQIASELGMKQPQWARYESGASSPSVDLLLRMCVAFGTTPNKLLGFKEEISSVNVHGSGNAIATGSHATASVVTTPANCKTCPHLKKLKQLEKLLAK